ncbi:MAG: hypothetical protein ACT6S0_24625 [Roseateles sp.]|uniref:hypothetical protein n=1 Tax=Roseateles sp. TaxID=1971397 RepID=UPI004035C093
MSSAPLPDRFLALLDALLPAPQAVDARERLGWRCGAADGDDDPAGPAVRCAASARAAALDAVLARYNQVLDVPRDDLADWLHEAELPSYRNRLARLSCADIMSSPVVAGQQRRITIGELVPLFSATGHHHIPIVGEQARRHPHPVRPRESIEQL